MDIKDSYLHGTVGVVKSISVSADKLKYTLADIAGTVREVTLPVATQTANGLLSKEDKKKLDNMIATKVANDLILKIDSGTTEGTSLYTYNGSAAKTLDIKSGTGIAFSKTAGALQIFNSGVRSIATGTANGTISVNTNGTSKDVAVKGLGSAAYTTSGSYVQQGYIGTITDVADLYSKLKPYFGDNYVSITKLKDERGVWGHLLSKFQNPDQGQYGVDGCGLFLVGGAIERWSISGKNTTDDPLVYNKYRIFDTGNLGVVSSSDNGLAPKVINTNTATVGSAYYVLASTNGSATPSWYKLPTTAFANDDTKVTQTNTTGSADYRVLFSGNANDTTETTTARKSGKLLFNPNTGDLTAGRFVGGFITTKSPNIANTWKPQTVMAWFPHISKNSNNYAGDDTGFPVASNANGILWLGLHDASSNPSTSLGHGYQLGFSSNGNIYSRYFYTNVPTTANGGSWKQIAYTTSNITGNAATADKLKTKRKLWGQDFDGSADVSGSLTGVTSINMNGNIVINDGVNHDRYIKWQYDNTDNFGWRIGYLGSKGGDDNDLTFDSHRKHEGWASALYFKHTTLNAYFAGVVIAPTFQGNIDWKYITNKPTSFTPAAHDHKRIISSDDSFVGIEPSVLPSKYEKGVTFNTCYSANWPKPYGNLLTLRGRGDSQIFVTWSVAQTATVQDVSNEIYLRSKRDSIAGDVWSNWTRVLTDKNYGSYVAAKAHTHPTSDINLLTGYSKASSGSNVVATDTLNVALGKIEYKAHFAYEWITNVTASDTDEYINKWGEIVGFLDSVKEGTDILDEFVTRKTDQTITGTKTFTKSINLCNLGSNALTGIYKASLMYDSYTALDANKYHPILGIQTNGGNVINLGAYINKVGFYGYYNGRTDNGWDWSFLFDSTNGAVRHNGSSITAVKFIKSGGTASQFLKADGSVDSNTYATTGSLANYIQIGTSGANIAYKKNFNINGTNYNVFRHSNSDLPTVYVHTSKGSNQLSYSNGGNSLQYTTIKYLSFSLADNGGYDSYLLIADLTNWKVDSQCDVALIGTIYGHRGGNQSLTGSYNITAQCTSYAKGSQHVLYTDTYTARTVQPYIVDYNGTRYLALKKRSSGDTIYFIGYATGLLSSYITVNASSNNALPSGLTIVHSPSTTFSKIATTMLFDGTYERTILHSGNYTSYTPILNSSSTHATSSSVIYAPTTAGTSGQILVSNGSGAPVWVNQSSISAVTSKVLRNYYSSRQTTIKPGITGDGSMIQYKSTSICTDTDKPGEGHILHFNWDNNGGWDSQLCIHTTTPNLSTRCMNSGTWSEWARVITSLNYTSYLGYIGTTAVQSSAATQSLTGIGDIHMAGDIIITTGDTDKCIYFDYDGNKTAGASWRTGMLGSGSGDTNYFVIQSGTSDTSTTTWTNTIRISQNTYDIAISGNLYPLLNNSKTLGTSSLRWANVYATTFTGNLSGNATTASSASKWTTARTLTVGNLAKTVDGSANVSWDLQSILLNPTTITTATSWDITTPGVYKVASEQKFTGTNNPESTNGGGTPYRYGQLIVSKSGYGLAQFYVSHYDSNNNSYGIKYRTGYNDSYVSKWARILDSTNYNVYSPTLDGIGAKGTWNISISGNAGSASTSAKLSSTTVISAKAFSLSNASWTDTGYTFASLASGTYAVQITSGTNLVASGIMSVYKNLSDTAGDEIPLHVYGTAGWRPYLRTYANKLQISSNDTSSTKRTVTIKIAQIL